MKGTKFFEIGVALVACVLALIVMFPSAVLAGSVYSNAKATFYNDAKFTTPGLPSAKGTATISYTANPKKWTVSVNISGLLKNHAYIFNISQIDQLLIRYDSNVTTDKSGKLKTTFVISDLDSALLDYNILRIIDLTGESGGLLLSELQPTDNPYSAYPNATMVMRAREDGMYGSLIFY
ncbi:hypothetical protein FJZ31_32030 [Candidatus Poribacteria bacterium]|nr:hypothetical protein [Candidatus Poribacteria bacterium]